MTNLPQTIEYSNQRILTSEHLATLYGTDLHNIVMNFNNNKSKYTEGKHYFKLEGATKTQFLNQYKIYTSSKHAREFYLWTEKGALLHAKSLGTDKAWEMYEKLVDEYYRLKDTLQDDGITNTLIMSRLRLFLKNTKIPARLFSIFDKVAIQFFKAEYKGVKLPEGIVPDISIGLHFNKHIQYNPKFDMALIQKYLHHYPDKRGTQWANLYPIEWLPEYEIWIAETYVPFILPKYLKEKGMSDQDITIVLDTFGVVYLPPVKTTKKLPNLKQQKQLNQPQQP